MIYYPENIERAKELGEKALDRLRQLQLPQSPNNYTLWYAYHSGGTPELTRDIDTLMSNNETLTTERAGELYSRYFGQANETENLRETGESLDQAITSLMDLLQSAGADNAAYGDALQSITGQLTADASAADVHGVVRAILAETAKMAEQHARLQGELLASTQEVAELREGIQSAQREALTDGLTGIANRKAFDHGIEHAIADARQEGADLSLLMLDIDHFKAFNDTYGHQAGDQVLRLVARTFTESIKGRDIAARYGGEEFAILLPMTRLTDAVTLAEHVRANVAGKRIVNRQTQQSLGQITMSVGAAQLRRGDSPEALIKRADEALYAAKNTGRNRVMTEAHVSGVAAA